MITPVFTRLRSLLQAHAGDFSVSHDTVERYGLEAPAGPATLKAWGGKAKLSRIPIAWVELRKNYVSYHLMGIDGNAKLTSSLSEPLRAHMQGKTCFNFKRADEKLLAELERLTPAALAAMRKLRFVADPS